MRIHNYFRFATVFLLVLASFSIRTPAHAAVWPTIPSGTVTSPVSFPVTEMDDWTVPQVSDPVHCHPSYWQISFWDDGGYNALGMSAIYPISTTTLTEPIAFSGHVQYIQMDWSPRDATQPNHPGILDLGEGACFTTLEDVADGAINFTAEGGQTPAPTATPTPTPIVGDANGDRNVDEADYAIWLSHFNTTTTSGASVGDFTNDGKVDGVDYVVWLIHYGT